MQEPQKILMQLGLAPSEIGVYLAMLSGSASVREVMKTTRQKRPTVYYALARLEERGLVRRTGRGDERYAAEPPERLATLAERRKKDVDALSKDIAELIPGLVNKAKRKESRPHVSFYEGAEAVMTIIMETLYCRSRHIDSIAPHDNFFWQVGQGFADSYIAERVSRKIRTRNLWEAPIDRRLLKQYYAGLSEIRLMPEVMHGAFGTTTFLFDDKTLSISSLDNSYALLVTSAEHHDTMTALFNGLWSCSKPLPG